MSMMRIHNQTSGKITYCEEMIISFFRDDPTAPVFVGSGFFVSSNGLFVTAKHVFFSEAGVYDTAVFGLVLGKEDTPVQLKIVYHDENPNADVMIGLAQEIDSNSYELFDFADIEQLGLDFTETPHEGKVFTYSFRNSEIEVKSKSDVRMKYIPTLYSGIIKEYFPERWIKVRNAGYHCNMPIEGGCSGAPVYHETNKIIGINSSSFQLADGGEPIMYASDINLIKDLKIHNITLPNGMYYNIITMQELQRMHAIR